MAVHTLYRAQAFGTGSDMWVVPERERFSLFKKADWYLNFQLTRAEIHDKELLSTQIKNISSENNFPDFAPPLNQDAPLLIAAENYFPTKKIIVLNYNSSVANWVKGIFEIWTTLSRPALRVFLPAEVQPDDFKKYWPTSQTDDVLLVPH